jgi:hypothetical protein
MDQLAGAPAMRVLGSPADGFSLNVLARQCGAGARTLERLFRTETHALRVVEAKGAITMQA